MNTLSDEFSRISALRFEGKRKILIADDNPTNLRLHAKFVETYLKKQPDGDQFSISLAHDGQEALEKIKTAQDADSPIEMLITDDEMPRKTGEALVKELGDGRPFTAMISSTLTNNRALEAGANVFYAKPASQNTFQDIFSRFNDAKRLYPATAPAILPLPKPSEAEVKNLKDPSDPFERAFAKHQSESQDDSKG